MKRLAAVIVALFAASSPARATEWMICSDDSGKASFSVLLGAMDVIAISSLKIEVDGKTWSTVKGEGTLVTIGQAFESDDQMLIDVTDSEVSTLVAQLRLFEASEADAVAAGGTLRIPGQGAWAVTCDGP